MKFVAEKIDPDSSLTQYLDAINAQVFFWASPQRLDRLRQAKEYRTEDQVVLHVDTRALVERHGPRQAGVGSAQPVETHGIPIPMRYGYYRYLSAEGVADDAVEPG